MLPNHKDENCETKIQDFIHYELGINYRVAFGNIHRFGKPGLNGTHPIVVRFIYRRELEHVISQAYRLKGKPYGISEQFPPEIENKRKELYPIMRDAKREGKKVKLVRDKLYINGKPYNKPTTEYRDVLLNNQPPFPNGASPPLPPRPFKRSRRDSNRTPLLELMRLQTEYRTGRENPLLFNLIQELNQIF